ncbi:hypothetical protein [Streptomyces sp. NRRL S-241]|nr:hypothetical protein [Streptomyces sp. NRRL S-241]
MRRIRWGDVLLSAVAAVGWSLIVMAGAAGSGCTCWAPTPREVRSGR